MNYLNKTRLSVQVNIDDSQQDWEQSKEMLQFNYS